MAKFELVGTQYGGWCVSLDLIPEGSTVISAGVGERHLFRQRNH